MFIRNHAMVLAGHAGPGAAEVAREAGLEASAPVFAGNRNCVSPERADAAMEGLNT
ncbi:MAG: hypothetical protein R3F11_03855 [Verrucomicrobiales bacterium]